MIFVKNEADNRKKSDQNRLDIECRKLELNCQISTIFNQVRQIQICLIFEIKFDFSSVHFVHFDLSNMNVNAKECKRLR